VKKIPRKFVKCLYKEYLEEDEYLRYYAWKLCAKNNKNIFSIFKDCFKKLVNKCKGYSKSFS